MIMGEVYDARLERTGWDLPGFDGKCWLDKETREITLDGQTISGSVHEVEAGGYPFVVRWQGEK